MKIVKEAAQDSIEELQALQVLQGQPFILKLHGVLSQPLLGMILEFCPANLYELLTKACLGKQATDLLRNLPILSVGFTPWTLVGCELL